MIATLTVLATACTVASASFATCPASPSLHPSRAVTPVMQMNPDNMMSRLNELERTEALLKREVHELKRQLADFPTATYTKLLALERYSDSDLKGEINKLKQQLASYQGPPPMGAPPMGAPPMGAPQYAPGAPQMGAPPMGAPQMYAPQQGPPQMYAPQAGAPPMGAPPMPINEGPMEALDSLRRSGARIVQQATQQAAAPFRQASRPDSIDPARDPRNFAPDGLVDRTRPSGLKRRRSRYDVDPAAAYEPPPVPPGMSVRESLMPSSRGRAYDGASFEPISRQVTRGSMGSVLSRSATRNQPRDY